MAIGNESATEFNINFGPESARPKDPLAGSVYLATDNEKMFVCYKDGIWQVASPLTTDENGVLLFNGKILTPYSSEIAISGSISTTETEIPNTVGKAGQLKTLFITRSGSTGTSCYISVKDKDNNVLVPEIELSISSGSTVTRNFTELIGDIVKKSSTDKIMIRSSGMICSINNQTLFMTGYIQAGI